jgi:hypothetical protein
MLHMYSAIPRYTTYNLALNKIKIKNTLDASTGNAISCILSVQICSKIYTKNKNF